MDPHPYIRHCAKLIDRTLTVQTANGNWTKPVEIIDRANLGDVIVVDVVDAPVAVWDELASNSAMNMSVEGMVSFVSMFKLIEYGIGTF